MTLLYFLKDLATRTDLSAQAQQLRALVFAYERKDDNLQILETFLDQQTSLDKDSAAIVNIAVMRGYSSEGSGFGRGEWPLLAEFYNKLRLRFPEHASFHTYFVDCACMADWSPEAIYPVLKNAILQNPENAATLPHEVFDYIFDSEFGDDFDHLLEGTAFDAGRFSKKPL
jgi:hypothetical protein